MSAATAATGREIPAAEAATLVTVTNVRRLLDGEEVTYEGKVHSFDKIKLVHPAATKLPIYMGVIGPRMLNLSGPRQRPARGGSAGSATRTRRPNAGAAQ